MTHRHTIAETEEQPDPNAEADYIIESIRNAIRSGNLEAAGQALEELQNRNERDTGYPKDSPFLHRAAKALLKHQIRRAVQAIAYRENPETATGKLLMLSDSARRFMEDAPTFRHEAEQTYQAVRMAERNILPLSQEQAEDLFRTAAGNAPEETGRPPLESGDAAWAVHRQARETFLKIRLQFPDEDHEDLSRFAVINLATAAAAACAAGILNPDGSKSKRDRFPDVSP